MRLIDADAFKKYLKEKFKDVKDQFQTEKMRSLAQKITNDFCCDIDEQPTVDAVPIDFLIQLADGKRGYYSDFVIEAVRAYKEGERKDDEQS